MKLKDFKEKNLLLYVLIGVLHTLLKTYIPIPVSRVVSVPHVWNRDIWTVMAITSALIISICKSRKIKRNYICNIIKAILITFITSFLCALIIFIFTPWVDMG